MPNQIDLVILGSTGSIGVQALEIVEANPDKFRVVALAAGSSNLQLLAEQAKRFSVPVVGTTGDRETFTRMFTGKNKVEVIDGAKSSSEIAAIACDI